LLSFILIKIEFHARPLSVGSHAKKERGYPIRVLISIVPSYTTPVQPGCSSPKAASIAAPDSTIEKFLDLLPISALYIFST
jgi:hypothetical protein